MSDNKWTPGPWWVCPGLDAGNGKLVHAGKHDLAVCRCATPQIYHNDGVDKVTDKQRDANACLIAAAPELYKALYRLFDIANHFHVNGGYFSDDAYSYRALVIAEEALAEARGEKQ